MHGAAHPPLDHLHGPLMRGFKRHEVEQQPNKVQAPASDLGCIAQLFHLFPNANLVAGPDEPRRSDATFHLGIIPTNNPAVLQRQPDENLHVDGDGNQTMSTAQVPEYLIFAVVVGLCSDHGQPVDLIAVQVVCIDGDVWLCPDV